MDGCGLLCFCFAALNDDTLKASSGVFREVGI